jgi:hypothetical protein
LPVRRRPREGLIETAEVVQSGVFCTLFAIAEVLFIRSLVAFGLFDLPNDITLTPLVAYALLHAHLSITLLGLLDPLDRVQHFLISS